MKIGLRLVLAFLTVASLVAIVSFITSKIYSGVLRDTAEVCQNSLMEIMSASEMSLALHASQMAAHGLLTDRYYRRVVPTNEHRASREAASERRLVENSLTTFEKWLSVSKRASESQLRQAEREGEPDAGQEVTASRLERLVREYAEHAKVMDRFLQLIIESGEDDANKFLKSRVKTHFNDAVLPLIRDHQGDTEAALVNQLAVANTSLTQANTLSNVITLIALNMAIIFGLIIARSIAGPVNVLKKAALRIGQGELDTTIQVPSSDEIGVLANTFNQMITELKTTMISRSYFDNIIQSMGEMLIVTNAAGRIETVNRAGLHELGFSKDELWGEPITMLLSDQTIIPANTARPHTALVGVGEHVLVTKNGARIPVYWSGSELRDENGGHKGIVYVGKNITEQKRVEEQLLTSLNEKKVLLQEIHHRVKNNLQIVSSLLSLQAKRVGDREAERMFRDSESQIRSMALIHEQLYQSEDLAKIDFVQYVHTLIHHLKRSYGKNLRAVTLHIDVDPVQLGIDLAIPCGLLINELVSNAMEHAFPAGGGGEIHVVFKTDQERYLLAVRDTGIGLQKTRARGAPKTLGLELVRALVRQLSANLAVHDDRGTEVVITFGRHCTTANASARQ